MPDIDAQTHAGIHIPDHFETIPRSRKMRVLRTVVVNGYANVVFLDEPFDPGHVFRGWSDDQQRDAHGLCIFEKHAHMIVVVFI